MKKVLISLDDIENMLNGLKLELLSRDKDADIVLKILATMDSISAVYKKWFDVQPDAPVYRSGSFKITPEQLDRFMQSDCLVLDGTRCKTCGQLGRIKEGMLSKIETTGGKDDN